MSDSFVEPKGYVVVSHSTTGSFTTRYWDRYNGWVTSVKYATVFDDAREPRVLARHIKPTVLVPNSAPAVGELVVTWNGPIYSTRPVEE